MAHAYNPRNSPRVEDQPSLHCEFQANQHHAAWSYLKNNGITNKHWTSPNYSLGTLIKMIIWVLVRWLTILDTKTKMGATQRNTLFVCPSSLLSQNSPARRFFFLSLYYFIFCIWVFGLCICLCNTYVPAACRGQKRELTLQAVVSLWKNSQCSSPLSYLSKSGNCYCKKQFILYQDPNWATKYSWPRWFPSFTHD